MQSKILAVLMVVIPIVTATARSGKRLDIDSVSIFDPVHSVRVAQEGNPDINSANSLIDAIGLFARCGNGGSEPCCVRSDYQYPAVDALIYAMQHLRPNYRLERVPDDNRCVDFWRCLHHDKKVAISNYYESAVVAVDYLSKTFDINIGDGVLTEKIINAMAETVVWDTSHEISMAARGFLERLVSRKLLDQSFLDNVLEARRQNRLSRGLPVIERGDQCPLPKHGERPQCSPPERGMETAPVTNGVYEGVDKIQ